MSDTRIIRFRVGDVVSLNTGTKVRMTVERDSTFHDDNMTTCVWFDGGEVRRDRFPARCLVAEGPEQAPVLTPHAKLTTGWREAGNALHWLEDPGTAQPTVQRLLALLHADARQALPKGTRYEIREKVPGMFGRARGLAWYAHCTFADREPWGRVSGCERGDEVAEGYIFRGEYVT